MLKVKNPKLRNKLLVVFLSALVVGAVFWFVSGENQETKIDKTVRSGEVIVEMLEDEYRPAEIYVKRGTKVTFINKYDSARWPASDLHPTHTLYSEFDPKRPLTSGEAWSFVFEKAGDWTMHDHLAPYITGMITVVE